MIRQTTTTTTRLHAECHHCDWTTDAPNGMGNAARHHDATGHPITIHIDRNITYGDPTSPRQPELFEAA